MRSASFLALRLKEASRRIGHNERCGSGLKYKHCHGLPGLSH